MNNRHQNTVDGKHQRYIVNGYHRISLNRQHQKYCEWITSSEHHTGWLELQIELESQNITYKIAIKHLLIKTHK